METQQVELEKKFKEIEIHKAYFSFDRLEILGCFDNEVHVKGTVITKEDYDNGIEESDIDDETYFRDAILIFKRHLFFGAMDQWLQAKRDYCERYGHYCGAGGSISSHQGLAMHINTIPLFSDYDEEKEEEIKKDHLVILVLDTDESVDMEHG